jgi:DNA-binding XRE family transcriptional regulator
MKVSNNLKYWREKVGATQKEMEWRTGIGTRQWTNYECGLYEPKIKLAQRFAQVLNEMAEEKRIPLKKLTTDDIYPPNNISK